ncbi:hypothetical protein ACFVYF_14655 [Streptomyces sp. NPDC058274]|uniref:hypothetical protein n=1 Tax=Streptomyces sp. NPDC058274 TaxID=3346416 RepID=UPI0036E18E05
MNFSLRNFSKCLILFEGEVARSADEVDPEFLEELTGLLVTLIAEVDPPTLEDDPGFWRSILFDVAIGDYASSEA